jgi:Na+-driven multidrug efflux pump
MVLYGGLRGAGDTKWVMYMTGAGQWGIRLVFSFVFGLWMGWGLPGVWAAMLLDVIIRACFVIARFQSGKWRTILEAVPEGKMRKVDAR